MFTSRTFFPEHSFMLKSYGWVGLTLSMCALNKLGLNWIDEQTDEWTELLSEPKTRLTVDRVKPLLGWWPMWLLWQPHFLFIADYIRIFGHNTEGGLFSSKMDAMVKNLEIPNAFLFSILKYLEHYRGKDGNFQFKLCYPEVGKCNEWIQTSNPATETTINIRNKAYPQN